MAVLSRSPARDLWRSVQAVTAAERDLLGAAIAEAEQGLREGGIPIGSVLVHRGTILGRGHNRRETDHDPTGHAEIIAIRNAGISIGHWRLLDCTLYVTVEPCAMCAGAIVNARIPRLVYGCGDPKAGAVRTLYQLCEDERLNHRVAVTEGVLAEECTEALRAFFREQRALGKK